MNEQDEHRSIMVKDHLSVFIKFQEDGIITQSIKELIEVKKANLSVSASYLAYLIGVTQQTLWNWTHGISHHCTNRNRLQLLRFMTGYYDDVLEYRPSEQKDNTVKNDQRETFQRVIGEVAQLFSHLLNNVKAADVFLVQLNKLLTSTKRSMTAAGKRNQQNVRNAQASE